MTRSHGDPDATHEAQKARATPDGVALETARERRDRYSQPTPSLSESKPYGSEPVTFTVP